MSDTTVGLRSKPDPDVDSASGVPTGPDFKALDRKAGSLVVNRWTYRPLRKLMPLIGSMILPDVDLSGLTVTDESIAGRDGKIVRPDTIVGTGAVLLIHGGGYVLGSPNETLSKAVKFARECGVPVVCPTYRVGPEDPFPAALDDCNAAWEWLLNHAEDLGIDPANVVIGGYSAGSGLAAAVVQRIHDDGGVQPAGQLLVYPMLDDATAARRDLDKPRHRVWSNRNNLFGWTSYLGQAPGQETPPYAVPARRDDLSGLPPAWIGVGTADLFLDESRDYASRLEAAGVDVTYVEVAGGIHGFDSEESSPLSQAFDESAIEFVGQHTS